jgi:Fur family transcriptional regulator, zinc uptake regulator
MTDTKLTRNQSVVVDALKDAGRPLSAYQILDVDMVRDKGLKAPLTIYRALDKLIEQGMVHRIESLNAFVLCDHDAHAEPAAFMICTTCKRTIEFSTRTVRRAMAQRAAEYGFQIQNMHLEVTGLCETCANAA